jgi:aldose 1-epimerase
LVTRAVFLNDGIAEAAVLPALGAGLAWYDLVDGGARAPIFRPCRDFAKAHPFDLANILLVPWSNRISGGGFSHGGTFHALAANVAGEEFPLHGNGFSSEWRVAEASQKHVAMTLESAGPGPSRYRARAAYELNAGALTVRVSATNRGAVALPFGLGLHPWIVRTPVATLQAQAKELVMEDCRHLPECVRPVGARADWDFRIARPLPLGFINNAFLGWDGRASVIWADRGLALDIVADPALSTAIIYSPGEAADFFCFEPVTHPVDAHNLPGGSHANGLAILRPGETLEVASRFAPRRL